MIDGSRCGSSRVSHRNGEVQLSIDQTFPPWFKCSLSNHVLTGGCFTCLCDLNRRYTTNPRVEKCFHVVGR